MNHCCPRSIPQTGMTRRQAIRMAGRCMIAGAAWSVTGCRAGSGLTMAPVPGPPQGKPELSPVPVPTYPIRLDTLPKQQPLPDLSDGRIIRRVAGIRPHRRGSYRLEHEFVYGKHVVHNYGHGGAGVTLSWGSAEAAVDRLEAAVSPAMSRDVTVLGGGVAGLSTAAVLLERGWRVSVHAKHFATQTTSNLAGAQFAPSGVEAHDLRELRDLTRRSAVRFLSLSSRNIGVEPRVNYTTARGGSALSMLPGDLLPSRRLTDLPFAGVSEAGRVHATFLIEPPRYLPWLLKHVQQLGGTMVTRTYASADEIAQLSQLAVVNCLGLGARDVFSDGQMIPIRGQLLHLEPQALPYMLSHRGYMFPRSDVLLLGGSYERGQDQAQTSDRVCDAILQRHRGFFSSHA